MAVENYRYDVLLGMPWNVEMKPLLNYEAQNIEVDGQQLQILKGQEDEIQVCNIGLKTFRSLMPRKKRRLRRL